MRRNRRGGLIHRIVWGAALAVGLVRGVPLGVREAREGPSDPIHPTTGFEDADLAIKPVILTGVGLILVLWAIVLLIYPIFALLKHENGAAAAQNAARAANPEPPAPRLQSDPRRDLTDFRLWEEGQLNGYSWVDRAHGIVSIPIDDAIRIVAQRGIPPQTAPPGMTYFDPQAGTRQTGFEGKVEPEPR